MLAAGRLNLDDAADFIVKAKCATYAAAGDEATATEVLVPGSKQLEFASEDWFYRDIYAGFYSFAGLETVYHKGVAVWSMVYYGGVEGTVSDGEADAIYRFLRKALSRVTSTTPYRGPERLSDGVYDYHNESHGTLTEFDGQETIRRGGRRVYRLGYRGGVLA